MLVTRLGNFWKFLVTKLAQTFGDFLGYFEKLTF